MPKYQDKAGYRPGYARVISPEASVTTNVCMLGAKAVNKSDNDAYRAVAEKARKVWKINCWWRNRTERLTWPVAARLAVWAVIRTWRRFDGEKMEDNRCQNNRTVHYGMSGTGKKTGMNRLFCIAMFAFCAGFVRTRCFSLGDWFDAKPLHAGGGWKRGG